MQLKNMLERILENYPDEEFLKADGFDGAVIGFDVNSMNLIYSMSKCYKHVIVNIYLFNK